MSALGLLRRPAVGPLIGAQLFTALGDNALLIVAIALLEQSGAAQWMSPALRICLYFSYVVLAPFAGALADGMPKGRLIVLVNLAKLGGCVLLAARVHPLAAFGAIGLAGVCYGPAKYGILAELVPASGLVAANAGIEVATVSAILGGTAIGAALLKAPLWITGLHTAAHQASLLLGSMFAVAALWAAAIPATDCAHARARGVVARFGGQLAALWRDPRGQVSLAVTALFWAVAAVLQFLVIRWAEQALHLSLGGAALLQCCLALGVVAGSLGAARFVAAGAALRVLPAGVVLGLAIVLVSQVTQLWLACATLCAAGVVAGIVMVPMNALLQQRGNALMGPGASIAVQGFSENLASLGFLAVYGALLALAVPLPSIIVGFGLLVTALMSLALALVLVRRRRPSGSGRGKQKLRLFLRLLLVLAHLLRGLFTCMVVLPWLGRERRLRCIGRWSAGLLRIFRLSVELAPQSCAVTPGLWVANHVSWIDVFVVNALFPSRFVAKSEVRGWPLVGTLSARAGTIFIARGSRRALRDTVDTLVAALGAGERVVVFPEGTSAAQGDMQPFRANLFEAALAAQVAVQPLAISYVDQDGRLHASVEYIGATSLLESMVAILSGTPVRAVIHALPALGPQAGDRRCLAQRAHDAVHASLAGRHA